MIARLRFPLIELGLSLTLLAACSDSDCSRTATCPEPYADAGEPGATEHPAPNADGGMGTTPGPEPDDVMGAPEPASNDGGREGPSVAIDVDNDPPDPTPSDASTSLATDAGTPEPDTELPLSDAGTTPEVGMDGSTGPAAFDSGSPEPGSPDAGSPEPVEAGPPPPPPEYVLSGMLSGMVGTITLQINTETLVLSENGPFSVPGWLAGETYSISVGVQPPDQRCLIAAAQGVFVDADISNVNITCNADIAELAVLELGGEALGDDLETQFDFSRTVSVFTQRTSLLATVEDPNAVLSIDEAPAVSGEPVELVLPLGSRVVNIDVQAVSGRSQRYTVEVVRKSQVEAPRTLTAPTPDGVDGFGRAIAVSGDILFVDRFTEYSDPEGPDGFLFELVEGSWLAAGHTGDVTGAPAFRLETGTVCPNTLAVVVTLFDGAPDQALRVANRSGDTWSYAANFTGFTGVAEIACDGDDIAVRHEGGLNLFSRQGTSWSAGPQYPLPKTRSYLEHQTLAMHQNLLVVGVMSDSSAARGIDGDPMSDCVADINCAQGSGAVYVFEKNQLGTWQQSAYVKASNAAPNAFFGSGVDVHDGVVLVGAYQEASTASGANGTAPRYNCAATPTSCASGTGATYLYERVSGSWEEVAYVKRAAPQIGVNFGAPVALFGDLFVVGTVYDYEFSPAGGSATLFHRGEAGITELGTFAPPDSNTDDYFPRTAVLNEQGLFCSAFNRQVGSQDKVFWYAD